MNTYFLKFADEAVAFEQLAAYRNENKWSVASHEHALDVIGTIYKPTGKMLGTDDMPYPEMRPVDGYHVNLVVAELPESLVSFAVIPSLPVRVFA